MKAFVATTAIAGLALTALGAWQLSRGEKRIQYHHNPFALHESAYGKLLAELSQETVDEIWHLGIEQVNPADHDHAGHDHDHADGEDCETCKKADEATNLLSLAGKGEAHPAAAHDDHSGHDHAAHDDHSGHDHAAHDDHSGHDHAAHDDHSGHDHAAHDDHSGHDHAAHDDHSGHDHAAHDDHSGHDHDHNHGVSLAERIASAKDFLVDLKNARFERTNPRGVSAAHRQHVAGEIEQMLLRSYKMDPTNYGVYNAYYLFLTVHELRSTPRAIEHARLISNHTIARAFNEDTAPSAWLTADMALLNLFLLDQEDWRKAGIDPPVEKLREYRQQSAYCKQQYHVLKQRAIADGRWETISAEKRKEMDEREQFAKKTFGQFDVMIARYDKAAPETAATLPLPGLDPLSIGAGKSPAPVADSGDGSGAGN